MTSLSHSGAFCRCFDNALVSCVVELRELDEDLWFWKWGWGLFGAWVFIT